MHNVQRSTDGRTNYKDMNELFIFPEIFITGEIPPGMSDNEVLAHALCAWGNCYAGSQPPPNFGKGMVSVYKRLGVSLPDDLLAMAKKINDETQN